MGLVQYLDVLVNKAKAEQLKADMAAMGKQGGDSMSRGMAEASRQWESQQQTTWTKIKGFVSGFGQGAKEEFQKVSKEGEDAAKKTEQSGGLMSKAWGGVKGQIAALGATLGALFAARSIYNFFKDSIEGADQAARAWGSLGQSVATNGENWKALEPTVRATLGALGDKYLFDPDDLAEGMAKVNLATGNTATSMKIMEAATALSRKTGLSLAEATDIMTQAQVNHRTRGLEALIGPLDKTQDLFGQVADRTKDAMNNMTPLEQSEARMALAWDDLKDNLGAALIKMIDASGIMPVLSDGVKMLTGWIVENKDEIGKWADWVIRAVKIGVMPVWGLLVGAFNLVKAGWYGLEAVFYAGAAIWDTLKIGVLDLVGTIDRAMIALDTALEKGLRFIGKGELADSLHQSVVQMQGDYDRLKATVATTVSSQIENNRKATEAGQKMAAALNTANDAAQQGFMKAGTAVHDWATEVTTSTEGAGDAVGEAATAIIGHTKRMTAEQIAAAQAAAKAFKKAQEDLSASYWQMVNATDAMTKQVLAEATDYAKKATAEASKANSDYLKQFTKVAQDETSAQADANLQRLQNELATQHKILDSATATADEKKAAFQKSADLEQQIDAARLASAQANNKDYMQSREYAEQESRNAMNETAGVAESAGKRSSKAAADAAMSTSEVWRNALDAIAGMAAGLGGVFGGVFKSIASLASQSSSAIGTIGKAISGLQGPMGGFTGFLSKLPGMLGAIGSAVGLITTVGGIVAHIFKGSKDPGRFNSDEEAYKTGMGGDAQARADASEYFKARAFVALGGGGEWATSIAQRDASEKWISTLRARVIRDHDAGALAELRSVYSKLGTAGFVEYKAWAEAERRAIPQGIAGFAMGGMVPYTGLIRAEIGEAVLSPWLTASLRQVLGVAGGLGGQTRSTNYQNTASVIINLYGVQDRDVPQRTVDALQTHLGVAFKRQSALQGNTQMPN